MPARFGVSLVVLLLSPYFGVSAENQKPADGRSTSSMVMEGCKHTNGVKSKLELDFVHAIRILYSEKSVPYFVVPENLYCYKDGEIHDVVQMETQQILGKVKINLVQGVSTRLRLGSDIKQLSDRYPELVNWIDSVPFFFAFYWPDAKPEETIRGLQLGQIQKSDNFLNAYSFVVQPANQWAKTVEYPDVAKMVATDPPYIIDTRPPIAYKWWHLPKANNFYVAETRILTGQAYRFSRFFDLQTYIKMDQLPKDHNAKILLMGHSVVDWSAFYSATMLRLSGYRNLYWYRKGQEDWHQIRRVLPDGAPPGDVNKITWKELEGNVDKYYLIDTRNTLYYVRDHMAGAHSLPYLTSRMPPRVDRSYTPESFEGDRWDESQLPKDKSKTLVMIGADEGDWYAVIATRKAMSLGYKALWYRGGNAEWKSLSRWYLNRFQIISSETEAAKSK